MSQKKVAVIGAGVSGTTVALHLGQLGLDVTLFEKEDSISSGPPYCHLHAGGNLYREISDQQCLTLLRQSIDFVKYYPFIVDYRPTVIATPKNDKTSPDSLLPRLKLLQREYERLIQEDPSNEVLGKSESYFKLYSRKEVEELLKKDVVLRPKSQDEWMITAINHIDLETIQFPLVLVQEYGMNLFRFGAGAQIAIDEIDNITFSNKTRVNKIEQVKEKWMVHFTQNDTLHMTEFDYLINASGFRTGEIDDMLDVKSERMIEFKASFISHWSEKSTMIFPEIIFHGQRGTPQGMAQFTPYPGGYFQLHGMTEEITLFEDGLVSSTETSAQPRLKNHFIQKLDNGWEESDVKTRTSYAIRHVQQYMPEFSHASTGAFPLFGAQQIPGTDPTLRVAEVSFPKTNYARCEIVKVSSSLDMVDAITRELIALKYIKKDVKERDRGHLQYVKKELLDRRAQELAYSRGYPRELANINVPSPLSK